jgi:hypothetical protein
MSHVSGPVSSLPGARRAPPDGTTCDDHPDRPATNRVQGETDSMGAEYHDLCEQCAAKMLAEIRNGGAGACDWCKQHANDLKAHRDFEESSCGPVYRVCGACRREEAESLWDEVDDSEPICADDFEPSDWDDGDPA